jgi:hypothetical protein
MMQKKETINISAHPGEGLFSSVVTNQMDHSFMEPFLGKIYTSVIPVSSQDEAYDKMLRDRLPHQIFIENYNPEKARLITDKAFHMSEGTVDLIYSSFNRLQFRVISEMPAFFGLSYPYTGHWNAWVNGNQARIYRANGASHALEIPKGESLIEFRYWSTAAFWGVVISSLTFILIVFYVCFISLNGLPRVIAVFSVLIIGAGFVMLWNYSLYTGDNLGTRYTWIYTPPESKPNNIAYGKITSSFPLPKGLFYYWFLKGQIYLDHTSWIVDGNKSKGSGYEIPPIDIPSVTIDLNGKVTHINKIHGSGYNIPPEDDPSVTIDLAREESINSLIIYASPLGNSAVNAHFELLISLDRKNWESVASIKPELKYQHPVHIEFDPPQTSRYIRIKVPSRNVILDEVEVYRIQE